jgi:opacity protein-like surface antigen
MRGAVLIVSCAALLAATPALASADGWRTDFGWDYSRADVSYKGTFAHALPQLDGIGIHIGESFGQYYSAELGYTYQLGETTSATVPTASPPPRFQNRIQVHSGTLDLYGFLPLFHSDVSLFATAGGVFSSVYATNTTATATNVIADKSEFDYRAGAGVEWNMLGVARLRGMVRYQSADFAGAASHAVVGSIGMVFKF